MTPPLCPGCGKLPWRPEHLAMLLVRDSRPDEFELTVCMYCSASWALRRDPVRLEPMTKEEAERTASVCRVVGDAFAIKRVMAEVFGGEIWDY